MTDNNFATKYRPTTLNDVVGQDVAKAVLARIAGAEGTICRGVTLTGDFGCGKSTLARIFGRMLNCEHFKKTGDVCNDCPDCIEASSKSSQTYLEIDATRGGVDVVRSLTERLRIPAPNGKRRLVVFDEVHTYGSQALSVLLKLVEEGVPNTIFMFCTTETPSSNIMRALWSRCINLQVTQIAYDEMKPRLEEIATKEGITLTDSITRLIHVKSDGHMRTAVSLLQLYKMSGESALVDLEPLIEKFFMSCFAKNRDDANSALTDLLHYPLVEVRVALNNYIRSIYVANEGVKLKMRRAQISTKLFGYFFNPTAQSALADECGMELLFRSFIDKACPLE